MVEDLEERHGPSKKGHRGDIIFDSPGASDNGGDENSPKQVPYGMGKSSWNGSKRSLSVASSPDATSTNSESEGRELSDAPYRNEERKNDAATLTYDSDTESTSEEEQSESEEELNFTQDSFSYNETNSSAEESENEDERSRFSKLNTKGRFFKNIHHDFEYNTHSLKNKSGMTTSWCESSKKQLNKTKLTGSNAFLEERMKHQTQKRRRAGEIRESFKGRNQENQKKEKGKLTNAFVGDRTTFVDKEVCIH